MKTLQHLLVVATLVIASTASAGILHNRDAKTHEILLTQGNGSASATVQANRMVNFRCVKLPCKVTMKATGQSVVIKAQNRDLVIKSGKLSLARATK